MTLTANEKLLRAEAGCVSKGPSCSKEVFLIFMTNLRNISYNLRSRPVGKDKAVQDYSAEEGKESNLGMVCLCPCGYTRVSDRQ